MQKNDIHCNGGFLDMMDFVNSELQKLGKEPAIGFERDKQHQNRIRFFDKNNKTVWLPDRLYKRINIDLIKMGALKIDRRISNRWKQIATGNYTDLSLKIEMKCRQLKQSIKNCLKPKIR